jgi:hypothetical protein
MTTEQQPNGNPNDGSGADPQGGVQPSTVPPSGSQPAELEPRTLFSAGLRFGSEDPVPDSVKGKSPKEIADLVRQYEQAFAQVATQYQPQSQSQPAQPATQPTGPQYPTADPGLDPDLFRQQLDTYVKQTATGIVEQQAGPVLTGSSKNARWASSLDPEWSDIYRKYGPEIDSMMASVPMQLRVDKEVWDNAARIVRGNHVEEIATARAEQMVSGGSFPTERTGSAPAPRTTPAYGDELDEFFATDHPYVQYAKDNGVTAADMREYARKAGRTPADQVQMCKNSATIRQNALRPSEHGDPKGGQPNV